VLLRKISNQVFAKGSGVTCEAGFCNVANKERANVLTSMGLGNCVVKAIKVRSCDNTFALFDGA